MSNGIITIEHTTTVIKPISVPSREKGKFLGKIEIMVWANSKPDYSFTGNLQGKDIKVVGHHLRRQYLLSKRGTRRMEEKRDAR